MVGTLVALVTAVSSEPIQRQLHSRHSANICWMNKYINKLMHLLQWVDFNLLWNKNLGYQIWAARKYMLKYIILNVTPSVVTSLLAVHNLCEAWHSQPVLHGGVEKKKRQREGQSGLAGVHRLLCWFREVICGSVKSCLEQNWRLLGEVATPRTWLRNSCEAKPLSPRSPPLVGTRWHFRCKRKNRWVTRRGHPTHPAAVSALFADFRLFFLTIQDCR